MRLQHKKLQHKRSFYAILSQMLSLQEFRGKMVKMSENQGKWILSYLLLSRASCNKAHMQDSVGEESGGCANVLGSPEKPEHSGNRQGSCARMQGRAQMCCSTMQHLPATADTPNRTGHVQSTWGHPDPQPGQHECTLRRR